jgi:uncharacterized protein (DUF1778 family)
MSTVVGARFSDIERAQVEAAAGRLGLNLSGFVRQAALQASAVVGKKAVVVPTTTPTTAQERESRGIVLLEAGVKHHFVDGLCVRCHRDADERDSPCSNS